MDMHNAIVFNINPDLLNPLLYFLYPKNDNTNPIIGISILNKIFNVK